MRASIAFIAAALLFSTPALAQRGDDKKKEEPPRRAEPAKKAPAGKEPAHVEPPKGRAAEPQRSQPQHAQPQRAEPKRTELKREEPQHAQPQRAEPQHPDQRRTFRDQPGHPDALRVHVSGNVWTAHDHGRDDPRFRLQRPFEHGRFAGRIGSDERWHLRGGAPGRFYVGAGYFRVARWEYGYVDNWYWDRDEILIYDDPDSEGWYIAYNVRMQTYVHIVFLGN